MDYVVKTIGIIFLAIGIILILKPDLIKSVIEIAKVGKRCYFGGVVRIVIGSLLLTAIPGSGIPLIPGIIGGLILISGIMIFAFGIQKVHAVLDWFGSRTEKTMRMYFSIAVVVGILLIYSV